MDDLFDFKESGAVDATLEYVRRHVDVVCNPGLGASVGCYSDVYGSSLPGGTYCVDNTWFSHDTIHTDVLVYRRILRAALPNS